MDIIILLVLILINGFFVMSEIALISARKTRIESLSNKGDLKAKTALLNEQLTDVKLEGLKVMNFEMESSALFALGRSLGHQCTTICLGIGNRPKLEFSKGYTEEMTGLIRYVLDRV
jgi:hypothetical protein